MPYPFVPMMTWGEFMSELAKMGVKAEYLNSDLLHANTGKRFQIQYLYKTDDNGNELRVPIIYERLDDRITPTVLRSICNALKIDPACFGFTLG